MMTKDKKNDFETFIEASHLMSFIKRTKKKCRDFGLCKTLACLKIIR